MPVTLQRARPPIMDLAFSPLAALQQCQVPLMVLDQNKRILFVNDTLLGQFQALKQRYHLQDFPEQRSELEGHELMHCLASDCTTLSRLRIDQARSYVFGQTLFSLRFHVAPLDLDGPAEAAIVHLEVLYGQQVVVERICNASAHMREEREAFKASPTTQSPLGHVHQLMGTLLGHTYNHLQVLGKHLVRLHDLPWQEDLPHPLSPACAQAYADMCLSLIELMEQQQHTCVPALVDDQAGLLAAHDTLRQQAQRSCEHALALKNSLRSAQHSVSEDVRESALTRNEAQLLGDVAEQGRVLALLAQLDAAKAGDEARHLAQASADVIEVTEQGAIASSEVLALTHNSHAQLTDHERMLSSVTHKANAVHKRLQDIERLAHKLQSEGGEAHSSDSTISLLPDETQAAKRIRAASDYTSRRLTQRDDL